MAIEPRRKTVGARVTEGEANFLRTCAERKQQRVSEWLRRIALQEAARQFAADSMGGGA